MATKVHLQIGLSLVNYEKKTKKHLSADHLQYVVFTQNKFLVPVVLAPVLSVTAHTDRYILIFTKVTLLWDFTCISTDKCLVLLMDQGTHSLTDELPNSTNWPIFRSEAIFRIRNLYLPSRDPVTLCWFHVSVFKEWGRRGHMSFVLCRVKIWSQS